MPAPAGQPTYCTVGHHIPCGCKIPAAEWEGYRHTWGNLGWKSEGGCSQRDKQADSERDIVYRRKIWRVSLCPAKSLAANTWARRPSAGSLITIPIGTRFLSASLGTFAYICLDWRNLGIFMYF